MIELPAVGDLAVNATENAPAVDEAQINNRFAPRNGVVVGWSAAEITVVDLDNNKSIQLKAFDRSQVTGRKLDPNINEELWVLYGPYAEGRVLLKPRITNAELRFPDLLVNGRIVHLRPIRFVDGLRKPSAVLIPFH